ncbi:MAG: YbaK/EbsC family protein [Pseudomonadota bacterium]
MSKSLKRVLKDATERGLTLTPLRLDDGTLTAADAAAAAGCTAAEIVKSVVLRSPETGEHFLFLTAGSNRVDLGRAGAVAGQTVEMADAESIRRITGFAIGGVSPFGHLTPLRVWIDPEILGFATVWAAAGTPHHIFEIEPETLRAATEAVPAAFTL